MEQFFKSLTPEQISVLAGIVAPYVQWALGSVVKLENEHKTIFNWLVSFALPALGTVAVYLSTNTSFTHLLPIYGTLFATAQIWYFAAIRGWRKYFAAVPAVTNTQF